MSIQALHWAFCQRGVSDGCARLLNVLADYADEEGICWPSRRTLADRIEKSVDTVDRRAAELVTMGLLSIEQRVRAASDGKVITLTNVYRLHLEIGRPSRKSAAGSGHEGGRKTAARLPHENPSEGEQEGGRISAVGVDRDGGRENAAGRETAAPRAASAAAPRAASAAAHRESTIEPSVEVVVVGARACPPLRSAAAQRLVEACNSPWLDPMKAGTLVTTQDHIDRLIEAGADLERIIIPVFQTQLAKMREPVRSFRLFDEAVRAAAARDLAPVLPITPMETPTHGPANGQTSARERAASTMRGGMLEALAQRDAGAPDRDLFTVSVELPDADAGTPRRIAQASGGG